MRTQVIYRDFLLMLSGQMISKLGSSVYLVAVILFIKELTGSPSALGMFQFIAYLPIVLLTPIGGMFADSAFKKRIIIVSDIIRGAVMIALGLLAIQDNLGFGILLAGTFVVSSCTALFLPAAHALFPEIVPSGRLRHLNSVKSTSLLGANFAGTSLGGAAFAVFGPAALFIANGLSFALSAVPEAFIRYKGPSSRRTLSVHQAWRLVKRQFREVSNYIRTTPGLGPLLLTYSFVNSLYPPVILALPFLLEEHYGFGPQVFGIALALLLAGGGAGALIYGFFPAKARYNSNALLTALSGLALLLALLWPIRSPLYLWCALPVSGAAIGVVHQVITTSLYRLITPSARGKVFGIMESMASFSVPLTYAAAGLLIQAFLVRLPLYFAVIGAVIAVMSLLIHFFSRIEQFISQ